MYQTVGQDAIEYVARALDVPLYRRVISGSAVDMSSEYGSRNVRENGALEGDETEDLYTLLSDVKVRVRLSINDHYIYRAYRVHTPIYKVFQSVPSFQTTNAFAWKMCKPQCPSLRNVVEVDLDVDVCL